MRAVAAERVKLVGMVRRAGSELVDRRCSDARTFERQPAAPAQVEVRTGRLCLLPSPCIFHARTEAGYERLVVFGAERVATPADRGTDRRGELVGTRVVARNQRREGGFDHAIQRPTPAGMNGGD